MPRERPAEPWLSFLTDLDAALDAPADLHCIGGFVVSQLYGFARETADLDVLTVVPPKAAERVAQVAGKGSPLQRKHHVYIDHVAVANFPVRLWALEPHDLALTKLERSNDRDIQDVMYLAQAGRIRQDTLISRFETELGPYLTGRTPAWNRNTLAMWVEACWPKSS